MCYYHFGDFWTHCYASTQTVPVHVMSTDKAAIRGEELSQTLLGSVTPKEDEVALLIEQYSASKCIVQLIVVSCLLACSVPFS